MMIFNSVLIVLVSCVLCIHAQSDEFMEHMTKVHVECLKETGVKQELLDKLKKSEYTGDGTDLDCFPKCFFLKNGFMDDHGEFLLDKMKETLKKEEDHEKLFKLVDDCNGKSKDKDVCIKTFMFYKCWCDTIKAQHIMKKMYE